MIRSIADFAPNDSESGVGLVLQDDDHHYLFSIAGNRHRCPSGELFYAGIGGHREAGEDWITCARREAKEEIGTDIEVVHAQVTWFLSREDSIRQVEVSDRPQPLMLYEMIHPRDTPRAGEIYRIVIFKARLCDKPRDLSPDEVKGIIALTREQVVQSLARKPLLTELLDEGALMVAGENVIDRQVRLYPLGTAKALAVLLRQTNEA